jgi:hypothetical protein
MLEPWNQTGEDGDDLDFSASIAMVARFLSGFRRNSYIHLESNFLFLFPYSLGIRQSFCLHIPGSQPLDSSL